MQQLTNSNADLRSSGLISLHFHGTHQDGYSQHTLEQMPCASNLLRLPGAVLISKRLNHERLIVDRRFDVRDFAVVIEVESFREAQNAGKQVHRVLCRLPQVSEPGL